MKLKGAQILVETLIEQGTKTIFGYPGGQVIDIYDALYLASDRIQHVITAHEQGAAHAADGYARATGKVGVVLATSGPGATIRRYVQAIVVLPWCNQSGYRYCNRLPGFHSNGCHHGKRSELSDRTRQLPGSRHHRHNHADHQA